MKRTGFLFASILILTLFNISCKKNKEIAAAIKENGMEGNYQLYFLTRLYPGPSWDSSELVNQGLMCNFTINNKRRIIVYSGDNHDEEVAEWIIEEFHDFGNYYTIALKMRSPNYSEDKIGYTIYKDNNDVNVYRFAVYYYEKLIFLNNKNVVNTDNEQYFFRMNRQ